MTVELPDEIFIDTNMSDNRYSLKDKEHRTKYTRAPIVNAPVGEVGDDVVDAAEEVIYRVLFDGEVLPKGLITNTSYKIAETLRTFGHLKDASGLVEKLRFEIAALRKKVEYIRFRCEEKSTTLCDAVQVTHNMLMTAATLEQALKNYQESGE